MSVDDRPTGPRAVVVMLGIAAALLGATPNADAAAAQGPSTLTVSPAELDLHAQPGERLTELVSLDNRGRTPLVVGFEHADFGFQDEGNAVRVIDDDAPVTTTFSTRRWLSVPRPRMTIPAGGRLSVPLSITVPSNTLPGTHLGIALFDTLPSRASNNGTRVLTSIRTGPLVFVAVGGNGAIAPEIRSLHVPGLTSGTFTPRAVLAGSGTTYYQYVAQLRIDGHDFGAPLTGHVVPGIDRTLTLPRIAHGLGSGRHTVTLQLTTEPGARVLSASHAVWVVPQWLRIALAAALVVLIGALTLALALRRRSASTDTTDPDPEDF